MNISKKTLNWIINGWHEDMEEKGIGNLFSVHEFKINEHFLKNETWKSIEKNGFLG